MSTTTETAVEDYSLRKGWRTLALAGGVVGLLGILAIVFPFVAGISMTYALGALLLLSGIVHGVHTFSARGWRGRSWQLVLAVVSVIAGIVLLANPIVGLASLTLLLVAYLLIDGVAELWMGFRMGSQPGRGWIAASGAISVIVAAMLWAAFPADAVWLVGLVVGVSLLTTGLSMVIVAMAGRDTDDHAVAASEPRGA